MSDASDYLDAITEEGKDITMSIEIKDKKKAKDLLGTMYGKNVDYFGVAVTSWGFWNIGKAEELRVKKITDEMNRHQIEMGNILAMSGRQLIEELDNQQQGEG